jgi:hypothetical protein
MPLRRRRRLLLTKICAKVVGSWTDAWGIWSGGVKRCFSPFFSKAMLVGVMTSHPWGVQKAAADAAVAVVVAGHLKLSPPLLALQL